MYYNEKTKKKETAFSFRLEKDIQEKMRSFENVNWSASLRNYVLDTLKELETTKK